MNPREAAKTLAKRGPYEKALEKAVAACKAACKGIEEKILKLQKQRTEAIRKKQQLVSEGRRFSQAQSVLDAAFRRDPEHLEARRAPKQVRPLLRQLERKISVQELAVREGADYIQRLVKSKALSEELQDIKKHQALKESELAELRSEREHVAAKLERLELAHLELWEAFLESVVADEATASA